MQPHQGVSKFDSHTDPESLAFCVAQSGYAARIVSSGRTGSWLSENMAPMIDKAVTSERYLSSQSFVFTVCHWLCQSLQILVSDADLQSQ